METQIEVPGTPVVGTQTTVQTTPVVPAGALVTEPATHNYRAVQVIWMVTTLVTTLIAIRFLLKLFGASLQSGFVAFLYGITDPLVAPFRAIFPNTAQGSTLEVSSLVAIVIYALVGYGIVSVVKLMTTPRGARSVS
jgi:uncharacterized protein YggT (Ycf19 family)